MKKNKKIQLNFLAGNRRGMVSAYLLIATAVAVTLITGLVVFVVNNHQQSVKEVSRQKAIQIAESGIYYYKWYLAHSLDGKNVEQVKDFWANGNPSGVGTPYEGDVTDFDDNVKGSYEVEVEPPDPHSTIVVAKSTGWTVEEPGITQTVQVRFRRPSWSEYAVLANDVVKFGEETNIYGPVHSNNGVRFEGTANNKVVSAVETYLDPDTSSTKPGVWTSQSDEDSVFLAGYEFPVPEIDFSGVTTDLGYMKDQAQLNGLYFGGETYEEETCKWKGCPGGPGKCQVCETETISVKGYHVTFRTDDKIEVRMIEDYQGDNSNEPKTYKIKKETDPIIYDMPSNGLVFMENHVWVDGQIDTTRVTVAAANLSTSENENIYINENILYTNKDGSDVIGLVAEGDVLIGLYSANDLEIDAALLAKNGKIGRDHYTESHSNAFNKRNRIVVYGSLATNERYGFAWTDGTGYQIRDLYFDNNLLYYPPPYFPTGSVYELDLWEDL